MTFLPKDTSRATGPKRQSPSTERWGVVRREHQGPKAGEPGSEGLRVPLDKAQTVYWEKYLRDIDTERITESEEKTKCCVWDIIECESISCSVMSNSL